MSINLKPNLRLGAYLTRFYTLGIMAALAAGSANATTLITLNTGAWFQDNSGAYLWQHGSNGGALLRGYSGFLQLQTDSNAPLLNNASAGWNYGSANAPEEDDPSDTYSVSGSTYDSHIKSQEAVQLSAASTIEDYQGNTYYAFFLDINEDRSSVQDLMTFEVYLTDETGNGNFGSDDLAAATPHFTLECDYTLSDSGGTSRWDVILAIPEVALGTDTTKYVHVFAEYQNDEGGSDKIGFGSDIGDANPIIPEPSSSLLLTMGAAFTLLRRRRA